MTEGGKVEEAVEDDGGRRWRVETTSWMLTAGRKPIAAFLEAWAEREMKNLMRGGGCRDSRIVVREKVLPPSAVDRGCVARGRGSSETSHGEERRIA